MNKSHYPILLQLGTNMGDRKEQLRTARNKLASYYKIMSVSSIYETAAWGKEDQEDFYNQLIEISGVSNPYALLRRCQAIEKEMGRTREIAWGPRIIDIDIIFYRNKIIFSPELTIPHPYFHLRRFILEPMSEFWGAVVDPLSQKNCDQLLEQCTDDSQVVRI